MFCCTVLIEKIYSCPCDSTVRRNVRYRGSRQTCLHEQFGPSHVVFVLHRREVHRRGLCLTNVVQAGIANYADDLQILPVPRTHDIEVLADSIAFREELFGKVLAYYGYPRRMVVVLPIKLAAS